MSGGLPAAEVVEGADVGFREVLDVDVVADAGAIRRGVVGAENGDVRGLAGDGHEGAGDDMAFGRVVLADQSVGGAATGIEITEDDMLDAEGLVTVAQDLFQHEFAAAVGVDGLLGMPFVHGNVLRIAEGGAGGGEDEVFGPVLPHGFEKHEGRGQVVGVILQRFGHGFAHHGVGGEVEHGGDLIAREDAGDDRRVSHVADDEFHIAGDEGIAVAVFEGIKDDDMFPGGAGEMADRVGTDVTGAAGDEDGRRKRHDGKGRQGAKARGTADRAELKAG